MTNITEVCELGVQNNTGSSFYNSVACYVKTLDVTTIGFHKTMVGLFDVIGQ